MTTFKEVVTSDTTKNCSTGCIVSAFALKIHECIQTFEPHSRIPGVISGLVTMTDLARSTN